MGARGIVGVVAALTLWPGVAEAAPIISEVRIQTDADATAEWVEIVNPGLTPVSLADYELVLSDADGGARGASTCTGATTVPLGPTVLQPGQHFLLADDDGGLLSNENGSLGPDHDRLPLTGGAVELFGPGGRADAVGYGESTTADCREGEAALPPNENTSLERDLGGLQDTNSNSADFLESEGPDPDGTERIDDVDGDGVGANDNCLGVANAGQQDADADGTGDVCDPTPLPAPPPAPQPQPQDPPPTSSATPPVFSSQPVAGKPVVITFTLNGVGIFPTGWRLDLGEPGGQFATSACSIPTPFNERATVRFSVLIRRPGRHVVRVTPITACGGLLATEGRPGETVVDVAPATASAAQLTPPASPQGPPVPLPKPKPVGGCRDAELVPTAANLARIRAATLCLVNVQRRRRKLVRVRADRTLLRAASAHSADMLRRKYFSHEGPGGPSLNARLRRAKFRGRAAGENIAWGAGALASPQQTIKAWLGSPPHRRNLLDRRFRRLGISVRKGAPKATGDATTYVTVYGR